MENRQVKLLLMVRLLILVLVITLGFLLYFRFSVDDIRPKFYLVGDTDITLEVGEKYKEPGFVAVFNNTDYRNNVSVISNVNTSKVGNYTVSYTLYMKYIKLGKTIQRKVHIVDTTPPVITINGDKEVIAKVNDKFMPSLATANDNYDGDLSTKVDIRSSVNTSVVGDYDVSYTVEDSSGNKTVEKVIVHVKDKNPYIEVSISNQELKYYEFNEVVFSSPVVTGINNGTPLGSFSVLYKTTNTELKGKDYTSFVYYWMAFKGSNYGIHDATWRSTFGGQIYRYNGSHGCVNMPYSKIAELFYMVDVGTPVYIVQ